MQGRGSRRGGGRRRTASTILLLAAPVLLAAAQTGSRTAAAVTVATSQAERGRVAYAGACAGCHGDALHGDEGREVPALEGPVFAMSWDGQPLADLTGKIQRTMPADAPGTLRPADVAAIAAFVLRANGVPEGTRDIADDPRALEGLVLRLAIGAR